MARYIDVDIAIAQITRLKDNDSSKYDLGLDTAINEIKHHMQTADVVEVVRCEKCAHHKNANRTMYVWCECVDGLLPNDWFCADGERRTDDDRNG